MAAIGAGRHPTAIERTRLAAREGEVGSTVLETALVLPPFFLLLFGLFSFSLVLFGYCNATFSSRSAARYASLHSSASLAPCTTASVTAVISPYLALTPGATATVTPTWPSGNTVGNTVTVSVKLVYSVGIPFSALKTVTVGSTAQRTIMR
jgi:Flp pilus assembly protein TadG